MAVSLYAALLGLLFIFLSIRVIQVRRALLVPLGDDGDERLLRVRSVHANFAQYTPFCIVLIALIEIQGGPLLLIHGLGISISAWADFACLGS